jgi:hypothetical protein
MQTARISRPSFPGAGERARLSIKGVGTPIGLRVARRREGQVTLVQELPFLALGNEVKDESGRSGKIARVAVSIDHGVPKLVIELAYDAADIDDRPSGPPGVKAPTRAASERRRDQTLGYDERPTMPDLPQTVRREPRESNREDTVSFRTHSEITRSVRTHRPDASDTAPRRNDTDRIVDQVLARFVAFVAMLVALVSPRTT